MIRVKFATVDKNGKKKKSIKLRDKRAVDLPELIEDLCVKNKKEGQ